jgi:hypothetical protein
VVERLNFAVRGVPDGIAAHAVQACHRGVARHLWQKTSIVVLASLQSHGLLLSHLHVAQSYHERSPGYNSAGQCHTRQEEILKLYTCVLEWRMMLQRKFSIGDVPRLVDTVC